MLTKFLDPKNDLAFKRVFGTEKNKDILIHFLNDILDHPHIGEIKDVTFASSRQAPEIISAKQSIVDVLFHDQNGVQYIIEMQAAAAAGFHERIQYYTSRAYGNQLLVGENYRKLRSVVFVAITDFEMFPNKSAIKSEHVMLDRKTLENDLQSISFTFIELPKFTKKIEELTSLSEKWCYYLKHAPETTLEVYEQLVKDAPALQRAYQELEAFSWSPEDLEVYEHIKKRERDSASLLLAQFQQREEKGREEGIVIGEEQGIVKGKALGEASAKQSMALQMRSRGMDIAFVSELTGLSEKSILSL